MNPEMNEQTLYFMSGYWRALQDYGIWKDGVQTIGCLETPIKECLLKELKRVGLNEEHLEQVINPTP